MNQYDELFAVFQTNKIPTQAFGDYLRSRCSYHYDPHLFQQLIELSLDQDLVDLNTFVDSFNETVDTLQFRSDMLQNKIKEFKILQQQIGDQLQVESNNNCHITLQIMEATNLDCSAYVKINCGNKCLKTRTVKDGNWTEQFELPIDTASELLIVVHDGNTDAIIGNISFAVGELKEAKLKDISYNLQREDQMKIKTKLHCIIKYVHSKVFYFQQQQSLYKQEQQKMNEEITNHTVELKETQQAILCLSKIFNGTIVKTQSLPSILEIQEFEYRYVHLLNDTLNLSNWVGMFYKLTGAFIAFILIAHLYRTQFLELTILGIFMLLVLQNEITQKYLRIFTYLFVAQLILDLIWIYLYSGEWENESTHGEQKMEKFVILVSYMEFAVRIPFTIMFWRMSIESEEFIGYLQ